MIFGSPWEPLEPLWSIFLHIWIVGYQNGVNREFISEGIFERYSKIQRFWFRHFWKSSNSEVFFRSNLKTKKISTKFIGSICACIQSILPSNFQENRKVLVLTVPKISGHEMVKEASLVPSYFSLSKNGNKSFNLYELGDCLMVFWAAHAPSFKPCYKRTLEALSLC